MFRSIISLVKLNDIAELYNCPVDQLLSTISEDAFEFQLQLNEESDNKDVISIGHLTKEQKEIVTKIIHQFEILNKKG